MHQDPKVFLDARIPFGANLARILRQMVKQRQKNGKSHVDGQAPIKVSDELREFLLEKAEQYEQPRFIDDDPILVPHQFQEPRDIELAGFIAATLAWGQRKTILNSAQAFMDRMDRSPAAFLRDANTQELKRAAAGFVHRTFQPEDAEVFLHALQQLSHDFDTLEAAFLPAQPHFQLRDCLETFHERFFEAAALKGIRSPRTRKHVATPVRGSAAKRLNMFFRWMTRPAQRGVDFGIWKTIPLNQLMIPLDVHTGNVGRKLGLLQRQANDWVAVEELTASLRQIDASDPVRLDFALFGLGAIERF